MLWWRSQSLPVPPRRPAPSRLQVTVDETEDQTAGRVQLDTNLNDPGGVSRRIAGYESLLATVAERPELRVADLPIPFLDE